MGRPKWRDLEKTLIPDAVVITVRIGTDQFSQTIHFAGAHDRNEIEFGVGKTFALLMRKAAAARWPEETS